MVPSGPSGWHTCTHSGLLQWHAGTSADTDTYSGGCCVPTITVLEDRHQHLTAILPLSQKYFLLLPASWQWQFSGFGFHIAS